MSACEHISVCMCLACVFSLSTCKCSLILEKRFCKIYSDLDAIVLVHGKSLESRPTEEKVVKRPRP